MGRQHTSGGDRRQPDEAGPAPAGEQTAVAQTLALFESYGERVAITVDDRDPQIEWTYGDLLRRVRREARRLDGLGVGRGAVVAVLTGDSPVTFILRWAVNALGAAVAVVPDGLSPTAVAELLHTCRAGLLLADAGRHRSAAQVAAGSGSIPVVDVETVSPPVDGSPIDVAARPEDLASIRFTGGSTGLPKGVPRSAAVPRFLSPAALDGWRDTVQLLCTPVAHLAGMLSEAVLAAGGRVVLQPRFERSRVLAAIPREQVTFVSLMPRLLHQLLDHPDLAVTDTSSLRSIAVGSAPASPRRLAEALDRFGPIVYHGYGTLEATQITWIGPEELARPELRGTVGRPLGSVEVSIRDGQENELPAGETGEVWVRSFAVMTGYLNAPDQTAEAMRDGWFRTGDLGRLDGAGYLTLAGRQKEVIFAEHARIYPAEIDDVLLAHPAVAAAAVFGVRDRDLVETPVAAVVVRTGHTPSSSDLIEWVRRDRGPHHAPSAVHFLDALPTTPSAKVDRTALRERFSPR